MFIAASSRSSRGGRTLGGGGRQVERVGPDPAGHGVVHQRLEAADAQGLEHLGDLAVVGADVPLDERPGGGEDVREVLV